MAVTSRELEKRYRLRQRKWSLSSSLLTVPLLCLALNGQAQANPSDGTVVSGQADISGIGTGNVQINQGSDRAIINWGSFSIGNGEVVQFNQPGAGSLAVNRVIGDDPSAIYGSLLANGQVMLINPNGILFGPSSRVDVSSLIATTVDISDEKILNNNFEFDIPGNSAASIVNKGVITAAEGGLVALVAPGVSNDGIIQARLGKVQLAGANSFSIDLYGDGLISLPVTQDTVDQIYDAEGNALAVPVSNSGEIRAAGGTVVLASRTAKTLVDDVVNMDGMIEAQSVSMKNGVIVLDGAGGGTRVSGTIDASGKQSGEKGGTVKIIGDHIAIDDGARIDASGDAGGGQISIGGEYQGGGTMHRATQTSVAADAVLDASAITHGDGGEVVVWSDGKTKVSGTILATGGRDGGDGGRVETSGKQTLSVTETARVDASAPLGLGGHWLLDPRDVYLRNGVGANVSAGGTYNPSVDDASVNIATINTALASGVSVTITTNDVTGVQPGNLTLVDAMNLTPTGAATLTLIANNNIVLNNSITSTGALNLVLTATGNIVQSAGTVNTGNGNITISAADMLLSGGGFNAGTGTINITGAAAGTIALGAGAGAMSLSAAELAMMNANILKIGSAAAGAITIGADITPGAATLHLQTGSSITGTAGGIIATNIALQAGGTINLTDASTNATNVAIAATGQTVTYTDVNAVNIGSVNGITGATAATLNVNSGALTDSNAITATTLNVTSTGAVTLDTATNNVTNLNINAGANAVTYVDTNGFDIAGLTAGTATLTANGALTDSGTILASTLNITNNGGATTLNSAANDVDNLSFAGAAQNLTFVDADGINLAGITATNVTLTAGGAVTDSAATIASGLNVTAAGAVTLDVATNNVTTLNVNAGANVVTYVDTNGFDVAGLTAGTATLTGAGALTDSGAITATNLNVTNAGAVTFNTATNNVANLNINAGANAVTYVDSNALNISGITASTANITSGALTDSGAINAGTLSVSATGTVTLDEAGSTINTLSVSAVGQTVNYTDANSIDLAGITAGTFNLNAAGAITDSAATLVTNLNISNTTGATTLDFATNNVTTLTANAGANAFTFVDTNGFDIASLTAGTATLTANGALTDSGTITATTLNITNAGGATTLNSAGNDVDNLTVSGAGQNVIFVDADGINLAGVTAGNLTLTAGGAVTDSAATIVTGLNVTAAGNAVLDFATNNIATFTANVGANTLTYVDSNGFDIAGLTAGTATITASGALTDTGNILATTLNLINTGGTTTLNSAGNDVDTLTVSGAGQSVTFVDADAIDLAGITAGTFTLSAGGAVTDSAAIVATTLAVSATGAVTLDHAANNVTNLGISAGANTVIYNDVNGFDVTGLTAGTATLTGAGAMTDSGAITATNLNVTNAGAVTFNTATNNVANLNINAGANAVTYVDSNALNISGITASTANITSGALTNSGAINAGTLSVSATGTVTLDEAGSTINTLSVSAAGQTVNYTDANSIDLAGITAGTFNLSAAGAITDSAATVVTNLNISNTTGATTLDFATNDVTNLNIAAAGQTVTYRDANGLNLAGITASTFILTAGGAVTDSAATLVTDMTINNTGGATTLDVAANDIDNLTLGTAGQTVALVDTDGINLAGGTTGSLILTAGGAVSDSGATTATTLNVTATGPITLDAANDATNAVFSAAGQTVTYNDINALNLAGVTAGTLNLTTGGAVTDSAATVVTDLNITAGGSVVMDVAANNAANITIDAGANNVTYVDTNALNIAGLTAGTANITANGALADTGAITAATLNITNTGGATVLDNLANAINTFSASAAGQNVTFNDANAIDLAGVTAGTFTLSAGGAVTDSGNIIVTTLDVTAGGAVTLNNANNVTTLDIDAGANAITFADTNGFDVAGLTGGAITLTGSGAITDSGTITGTSLNVTNTGGATTLNSAGNDVDNLTVASGTQNFTFVDADDLNIAGATAGTLTLSVGGTLTDSGNIIATNLTVTNTAAATTLDQAGNDVDNLVVNAAGQAVTFRDTDSLTLNGMTAGSLALQVGGVLQDTAATVVTGNTTITAGANAVTLDFATNNFNDITIVSAGAATIADTDAVTINASTLTGALNVTANNGITAAGNVTANGVTFNSDLDANGTGDTTINGGATLSGNNNAITITANDLVNNGAITSGSAATTIQISDGGTIDLGNGGGADMNFTAAELAAITAATLKIGNAGAGAITVSSDVTPGATTLHLQGGSTITATAGGIIVNNLALQAGGAVNFTDTDTNVATLAIGAAGQAVSFTDASGFDIATVNGVAGITGGTITLNANGVLTDSAATIGATLLINNTGGSTTLDIATNDVDDLTVTGGANTVTFRDADGINLAGITAGTFTLTAGGAVTDSVAMQIADVNVTSTGAITLNEAANDFDNLFISNAGQTTTIVDADDLNLAGITAGTFTLNAGGAVTDTLATAATNVNITTTGTVTLDTATNDAANLMISATGQNVAYRDVNGLNLAGITADTFDLTAGGAVTDNAATVVANLGINTTGAVTLDFASNDADVIAINAGANNITFVDADGVGIGTVGAVNGLNGGTISLNAGGAVTQTQAIAGTNLGVTATGAVTLTNAANNVTGLGISAAGQAVSYTDLNGVNILNTGGANGISAGSLDLAVGGLLTDTAATTVTGHTNITAGTNAVTLDVATNDFGTVNIVSAAATTIVDANAIEFTNITGSNTFTANAASGITLSGSSTTTGAAVFNADSNNDGTGNFTLNGGQSIGTTNAAVTISAADLILNGTVNSGTATTAAQATGSRTIDVGSGGGGQFNVSQAEIDAITAGVVRIGGAASGAMTISSDISAANSTTLHLQSGSTITGTAGGVIETNLAITAAGTVNITDTSTDVDNLAVSANNQNVTFVDVDGININTVSGVVGVAVGTGTFTLTAGGAVSDSQNLTGGNLAVTSTGNITLDRAGNNFNNIAFSASGLSVTYRDANAVNIGTVSGVVGVTATTFNLQTTNGNINDNSALTIAGTTTLNAGTGSITFDLAANDFGTVIVNAANNVSIRDTNAMTAGNVTNTGTLLLRANQDLTINGDITSGGAVTLDADLDNNNVGTLTINNARTVSTAAANADITLIAADLNIIGTGALNSGTGVTSLTAAGTNRNIDIGGVGANFNISQAEIDAVTAGVLRIASGTSGASITLSNATLTAAGTLHLQSGSGGIDTSGGAITIQNLALQATGAGNINASNAGNDVDNLAISAGSGVVRFTDADGVNIGSVNGITGITSTGSVNITAAGITDSAASAVTNFSFNSIGAVVLDDAANDFNTIAGTAAGQSVTLVDADAVDIGQVTAGSVYNGITADNLTLTAGGAISDSQASTIANNTGITAGANTVTLDAAANDFGTVSIASAGNTQITDANAVNIGASTVAGTLAVNANNGITVTGNVTSTGAATFDADLDNNGSGTFTVDATRTVNTTNSALDIIANDIALNGNLNSGSADTTLTVSAGQTIGLGDTARTMTIDKAELARITAQNLNIGGTTAGDITVDNIAAADMANVAGQLNINARANAANIYFINNPSSFKALYAFADDSIYVQEDLTSTVGQISLTADVDGAGDPNGDQVYVSPGVNINAAADAIFESATGITIGTNVTVNGPLVINADTDNDGVGSLTINGGVTILTNNNDLSMIAADYFINGIINAGTGRVSIETTAGRTIGVGDAAGDAQISKAELARITAGQLYIGGTNTGNIHVDNVAPTDLAGIAGLVTFAALFNGAGVYFDNADSSFAHGVTMLAENDITLDATVTANGLVTIDADNDNDGAGNFSITATHGVSSTNNDISVTANDMVVTGTINSGTAMTTLLASDNNAVTLGGGGGALGLTSAELNNITADTLRIGDSSHGAISITADTTLAGVNTLLLRSGAGVTATAGGIVVSNLAVQAAGAVTFTDTATDVDTLAINTTTGAITFNDADAVDVTTVAGVTGLTTGAGNITLRASDMGILQAVNAGAGTVTLEGGSGATIGLGGAGGALNLTNAELGRITANTLHIGTAAAGAITVSADATPAGVTRLELQSGSTVTGTAGGIVVSDLAITAGGAVNFTDTTTDVDTLTVNAAGQAISFFDADNVSIALTGASANINAQNGITITSDFTGTGASSFNADSNNNGTGTFTLGAGVDIAVGNNTLNITAVDLVYGAGATTSSGTADTNIRTSNGGSISLGGAGGTMQISNAELDGMTAGILRIGDNTSGAITIASDIAPAGTSTLHLRTGSTITGTAGGITESELALSAGGTINISDATTNVTHLAVNAAGQTVSFIDATGINFLTIDGVSGITAGTFNLNTGGQVTDSAAVLATTLNITTSTGGVDLNYATTDVDNLNIAAAGQTVNFTDADGLNLSGINAGTFTLTAGGAVTDSGTLSGTTLNVTAPGNVTLDTVTNDFDNINITAAGQAVTYTDTDGFNINALTAANAALNAGGAVTDSGAITASSLSITGTGSITLDSAANDVDDLTVSAVGQAVSFTDADGINLSGITAGTFTVNAGGVVTDSAAILAGTLNVTTSTGGVTLDAAANDVDNVNIAAAGQTVIFNDTDGFNINGLTATTATLTSGGAVTDTGTTAAGTLNITSGGAVTLNSAANDVDDLYISAAGQAVTFTDQDGINLAGITSGSFTLGAGGAVTDSAPILTGALSVTSTGPVTLNDAGNDANSLALSAAGQTAIFNDIDGIDLAGITAGTFTLTAAGAVTDSAATVTGTLNISGTGPITLDFATNDADDLIINAAGQSVAFVDTDGLNLAGISAGTFTVTTGGALTDSAAITATTLNVTSTGPVTLDFATTDVDNLNMNAAGQVASFTDADGVNLTGVNAGTFSLIAGGAVTDSGTITATNLNVTATGGGVTLDNAANDVDNLMISNAGQAASFVDVDGINLAGITAGTFSLTAGGPVTDSAALTAGTLSISATGGPVTLDFATNDVDDLTLSAAGQNATFVDADGINLAGITAGNFTLTSGGMVTDSGAINTGALNVTATGAVTLDNANDVNSLVASVGAQTLTFNDVDGLDLAGINAGSINLTTGGAITDSGATVSTGITDISAGGNNVTLDHAGNNFNVVAVNNANNVALTDASAMTLNASAVTGTFNAAANNGLTVAGNLTTGGVTTLNGDADNNGTGNFTQNVGTTVNTGNNALNITARDMTIEALNSGSAITTLLGSNGGTISLGGAGGNLALTNAELDAITASILRIGDNTSGAITVVADIAPANTNTLHLRTGSSITGTAGGITETNLAMEAGTGITLTDTTTDIGTLAATTTAGAMTIVDTGLLTVGTVDGVTGLTATGGNLNLSASDYDIQQAINNGANIATLTGAPGGTISLGGAGGAMALSNAELNAITAGTLRIGSAGAGAITIASDIAPAGTGTLHLITAADITGTAGGIMETNLALEAGTGITVTDTTSNAGTLAATTTAGNITFYDTGLLTIGTVDGVTGLNAPAGNISLRAGDYDIQQAINSGTGVVSFGVTAGTTISLGGTSGAISFTNAELNAITASLLRIGDATSGAITIDSDIAPTFVTTLHLTTGSTITGTAGGITVNNLALEAGGAINITDTTTDVTNLAVNAPGQSVTFRDASGLNIGTVDGVTGVNANIFTLTAGGAVTDSAAVVTGTLNVTSTGAVTLDAAGTNTDDLTISAAGQAVTYHDINGFNIAGLSGSTVTLAGAGAMTDSGAITAGTLDITNAGAVTLDSAANDVDTLVIAAAGQAASFTDADGIDLAGITAGSFTLNAGGAVTDSAAITATTLNVTSTGAVTLDTATNDVDTVGISAAGQAVSFVDQDDFNISGMNGGTVSLVSGGAVTDSGAITAGTFTLTSGGAVTLNSAANDVDTLTINTAGQPIVFVDQDGFDVAGLSGTSATLTGSGAITDSGTITAGTLTVTNTGGATTLNSAGNDVDDLVINAGGQAASFTDTDGINLAGITAASFTLNAGGVVTDSAAIAAGTLNVTSTGSVTLDVAANDVNDLSISAAGQNATFTDADGVNLAGINAATFTLNAGGAVTDSAAITAGTLNVTSTGPVTLDFATNDVNDLSISAAGQATSFTDADGINLAGITVGSFTLSAGGAVTDSAAITAGTLNVTSTGPVTLDTATNDADTVTVNAAGQTVTYVDQDGFDIAGLNAGSATVTAGGTVTDSGAITATTLNITNTAGATTLNSAANDVDNLTVSAAGQAFTFVDQDGLNINGLTANSAGLIVGGALTQSGTVTAGTLSVTGAGAVTLTHAGNDVDTLGVSAAGQTVAFTDADGIDLNGITAGTFTLNAGGAVTDSAAITAATLNVTSTGAVTLDTATNDADTVTINAAGQSVAYVDQDGFDIAGLSANNAALSAGGAISDSGTITATSLTINNIAGATTLDSAANDVDALSVNAAGQNVTFTDADGIDLTGITAGTFTLNAGGAVTDSGAVIANTLDVTATGPVTLDVTTNDVNALTIDAAGQTAAFTDADSVDLAGITAGTFTLNAGGAVTDSAAVTAGTANITAAGPITLDFATNDIDTINFAAAGQAITYTDSDGFNINGLSGASATLTSGGAITDTGTTTVGTLTITSAGGVTLDSAANDIDNLAVSAAGQSVSVTDADGINLAGITAGALTINANGAVTDSAPSVVSGATSITVGAGNDITLDAANDFGSVAIISGNNVNINDINAVTLAGSAISGALNMTAISGITQSGNVTVGGNATFDADADNDGTGDFTINGGQALSVSGAALNITANDVALNGTINNGTGTTTILASDNGTISLGGAGGDMALTTAEMANITAGTLRLGDAAHGAITVAGNIAPNVTTLHLRTGGAVNGAAGAVDVDNLAVSAGGPVTLSNAGNDVTNVAISAPGQAISFRDANAANITTVDGVTGMTGSSGTLQTGGVLNGDQAINTPTLNITSGGAVTLNTATNTVTDLGISAAGQAVSFLDAGGINLTGVSAGSFNLSTSGAVTDSGTVAVTGTTTIAAGAGNDITLDNAANDFGTVAITTGRNVTLRDANAMTIGASAISGTLNAGANNGLTIGGAVTTNGMTTLNSDLDNNGTGDFAVNGGASLATNGGAIALTTNDVTINGAMNAGAGAITITNQPGDTWGLGNAAGNSTLSGAELQNITAASLTVGDFTSGNITIDGVSAANAAGIGVLNAQALGNGSTLSFVNNPSTFRALSALADAGMTVNANVETTQGALTLNGDYDDADDAGSDAISYGAGVTVHAEGPLSVAATSGGGIMNGALNLISDANHITLDRLDGPYALNVIAAGNIFITDSIGSVTPTGSTFLQAQNIYGDVNVGDLTLESDSATLTGTVGGLTDEDAAKFIVLNRLLPGPYTMNGYLIEGYIPPPPPAVPDVVFEPNQAFPVTIPWRSNESRNTTAGDLLQQDMLRMPFIPDVLEIDDPFFIYTRDLQLVMIAGSAQGIDDIVVIDDEVYGDQEDDDEEDEDGILFAPSIAY